MQSYRPYKYDVESCALTEDEWVTFAHVIQDLCHLHVQHGVSLVLGDVSGPKSTYLCDSVQRRAREMWKTAIASRVNSEDSAEDALKSR